MFWIALVVVVALLLGSVFAIDRSAQNAANHQSHYKLNTCVGWSTAAWVIITVIGMLTLKARGFSTKLLTGTFYGCLAGFAVLSVVFTVYFVGAVSNYSVHLLNREETHLAAYFAWRFWFSLLTLQYRIGVFSLSSFDKNQQLGLAQGLSGQNNEGRDSILHHIARHWRALCGLQQCHLHLSAFHHQGQCCRQWSPDGNDFAAIFYVTTEELASLEAND